MAGDRRLVSAFVLTSMLSMVGTIGCAKTSADSPARPASAASPTSSASPGAGQPGGSPSPQQSAAPTVPHPVSLQALMDKEYDGRGLRVGRVLARQSAYTRYFVTYQSGKLTISGIMNVPTGGGVFPVLVLNHGYIDPEVYTNGRGLMREQDYLARRGFVVLHTDYRNHAQSDDDPTSELRLRLGYTEDVVNAVLAVKRSSLSYLDRERIGLLGRSMGGGVTLNALVVKPGLVDAAVVFAPVSSNAVDNFNRWQRGRAERRRSTERIIAEYGSPERNPDFWRNVSAVNFFGRVSEPILIHHGTADKSCPIAWSKRTRTALRSLGKDVKMFTYEGEPHAFGAAWLTSMRRTVNFFDKHLRE
jgi:dipeptidyl aminopeptidase/acylaminoacyl peptidase